MAESSLGRAELKSAMRRSRGLLTAAAVFSAFVNLLMLTGPLFMLQVYDRVLASQSEATLVALLALVTALFALMAALDAARAQAMARVGARLHAVLSHRVDGVALDGRVSGAREAPKDLSTLQSTLASPAPFVAFDAPWVPIFVAALFVFHFWLGVLAVVGAVAMLLVAAAQHMFGRAIQSDADAKSAGADALGDALRRERHAVRALGMTAAVRERLQVAKFDAVAARIAASDRGAAFGAASRALRFYLQSAMLAAGAALAIQGAITPGAMIAASVLLGRALSPIEQGVAHWRTLGAARRAWERLAATLTAAPTPSERTALPKPAARIEARNATVAAPGTGALCVVGVGFEVEPGEALAVVGPSGGGKSTLARALTGLWPVSAGSIRIDGAAADQWGEDSLGRWLGYLPQEVGLMRGTIAENIARLEAKPDAAAIVSAARRAGAHEMILKLAKGYETMLDPAAPDGLALSGGQRQRIGLARALYRDPPILILDEPNAHLDGEGEDALIKAIDDQKARGGSVVMMAHRASVIAACDKVLVLEKGRVASYGPRVDAATEPEARPATSRIERPLGALRRIERDATPKTRTPAMIAKRREGGDDANPGA